MEEPRFLDIHIHFCRKEKSKNILFQRSDLDSSRKEVSFFGFPSAVTNILGRLFSISRLANSAIALMRKLRGENGKKKLTENQRGKSPNRIPSYIHIYTCLKEPCINSLWGGCVTLIYLRNWRNFDIVYYALSEFVSSFIVFKVPCNLYLQLEASRKSNQEMLVITHSTEDTKKSLVKSFSIGVISEYE